MVAAGYCWSLLLRLPGGHRYFKDTQSGRVAVADESGRTPELTEDGVLWLDPERSLEVDLLSADRWFAVPVKTVDGSRLSTIEGLSGLVAFLPLWTSMGGRVSVSSAAAKLLRVLVTCAVGESV